MFVVFGATAIVVSVWQAARASSMQERLQNELKASIANVPKSTAAEFMKSGGNVTVISKGRTWGFTTEQLIAFTRSMSKFATGEERSDLIWRHSQGPDSLKLSSALVEALRAAKWNLEGSGLTKVLSGPDVWGVVITVNRGEPNPSGGFSEVRTLLEEAKIPFSLATEDGVPSGRFRIHIGERPID